MKRIRRCRITPLLIAAVWLTILAPPAGAEETTGVDIGVDIQWGVAIPMQDGVALNATVYRPEGQSAPLPAIFTYTPYISDRYHDRAMYFTSRGYVFALVDVRGRGNSGGNFEPFASEADDGPQIVSWLAELPYTDGQVTMWGGSYAGWNQWVVAARQPPQLKTIVPAASPWLGVDFPMWRNIPGSYTMQWLTLTSGRTPNSALFGASDHWQRIYHQRYQQHLPFRQLDRLAGNPSDTFQEWLDHPSLDDYWRNLNPTAEQYATIDMPILSITGHHDGDQPGALAHYRQHLAAASEAARQRHYLIIGPWDHAGTRTPRAEVGGITFAETSVLDLNALHLAWYDWTLKDGPKPEFLKSRVANFVAGRGEWRHVDRLEDLSNEQLVLHLEGGGGDGSVFHSGRLQRDPASDPATDRYVYDPLDTRFGAIEREAGDDYLSDQTWAMSPELPGLVFHSQPFEQPLEITGQPELTLYLSIDQPDTDFAVSLYEIQRDGRSIFLTSDILRARYRDSLEQAKPVPEGEIIPYTFDGFFFFSREIATGSRLRLTLHAPNTIHLSKNYNSGGTVVEESEEDARTVRVTLHHDDDHRSRLVLPTYSHP